VLHHEVGKMYLKEGSNFCA